MKLRLRILVLLAYILIVSIVVISSISCGVEEHYYLPQLSEGYITRTLNTGAIIKIPPISAEFYYATYYTIFYRIYPSASPPLSNEITQSDMHDISSFLASDYSNLYNFTDPTKTSSVPSPSTFTNMKYFEIEFEGANVLSTAGGTLDIIFPDSGSTPYVNINGEHFNLIRSSRLNSPEPPDRYFYNKPELYNSSFVNRNADVAVHSGSPQYQCTYVSMYIAAVGTNPTNFSQIISKPTHISVFRLPN